MKSHATEVLAEIKRHSICNKTEIMNSETCGCYSCQTIFAPSKISHWGKETSPKLLERECSETALCPNCGFDFVIGDAIGVKITKELLSALDGDEPLNEMEMSMLAIEFKLEFETSYLKHSREIDLHEKNF